jgi:hypothetical protein
LACGKRYTLCFVIADTTVAALIVELLIIYGNAHVVIVATAKLVGARNWRGKLPRPSCIEPIGIYAWRI